MNKYKRETSLFFTQILTLSQLVSLILIMTPFTVISEQTTQEHYRVREYIQSALTQNLNLAQEQSRLKESNAHMQKARANRFPQVTFHAQYTVAKGGRTIDLAVGDMLNPIYEELGFAQRLPNMEIPLLPNRDQETKFRIAQPLFNRKIIAAERVHQSVVKQQEFAIYVNKVEISAAIRKSYYGWIQAKSAIKIAEQSLIESQEHLRVARKLVSQGVATTDMIFGAEAQQFSAEQELAQYQQQAQAIQYILNELLNRELNTALHFVPAQELLRSSVINDNLPPIDDHALLALLHQGKESAQLSTELEKSAYFPTLHGFVDLGIQGDRYSLEKEYRFAMGGVTLEWNIIHGREKSSSVNIYKAIEERIKHEEKAQKLTLKREMHDALQTVSLKEKALKVADKQLKAATEQYRLVSKKFSNGLVSFTELTNVKSRYNQAKLNISIVQTDLLTAKAELIRCLGITGI